jgi:hypothetical protein
MSMPKSELMVQLDPGLSGSVQNTEEKPITRHIFFFFFLVITTSNIDLHLLFRCPDN